MGASASKALGGLEAERIDDAEIVLDPSHVASRPTAFLIDYKKLRGKTIIQPVDAAGPSMSYVIDNFGTAKLDTYTYTLESGKGKGKVVFLRAQKAVAGAEEEIEDVRTGRRFHVTSPKGISYNGPLSKDCLYVYDKATGKEVIRVKLKWTGAADILRIDGAGAPRKIGFVVASGNPFHHARSFVAVPAGADAAFLALVASLAHDEVHAAKMPVGAYGPSSY
ncbi:unnamed protein product [Pedinophyceae sp. YPF-701]|nr:unnamed protein product [Pedinophyceae sp. YPF-701]